MATYPVIPAGARITSGLLTSMQPMVAAKTVTTSRVSTTTLAADPELQLPVEANAEYTVFFYFRVSGIDAGDMDLQFTTPAGGTGSWAVTGFLVQSQVDSGTRSGARRAMNAEIGLSTPSTATAQVYEGSGRLIMGSTAGNLTIDWAQNASNATATSMEADSWLRLDRIA